MILRFIRYYVSSVFFRRAQFPMYPTCYNHVFFVVVYDILLSMLVIETLNPIKRNSIRDIDNNIDNNEP
jgi:hypothetical protein